jgi:DNA polymerase-3 subunit delta
VKLESRQIAGFLRAPPASLRAVLVYGADLGLVRERADQLARQLVPELDDPFRVSTLTGSMVEQDAARLSDEAAAIAFTGRRRVVRWREAGASEAQAAALSAWLADPKGDSLIVIEAGDIRATAPIVKACEGSAHAAAIRCFADEGAGLEQVIEQALAAAKLSIEPAAMAELTRRLGADRLMTRSELEKLVLYMGPGAARPVTIDDVRAAVGDSAAEALDELVMATAGGDQAALEAALNRVLADENPVRVLRAVAGHLTRLHLAKGHEQAGRTPEQAVEALRPPVFWKVKPAMRAQLRLWSPRKLADALDLVLEAEMMCKSTGMPADAILGRCLMRLAAAARAQAAS